MKTAQELLENLHGEKLYITTRGTVGDADGLVDVDGELIGNFDLAEVKTLDQIKEIEERAYDDIIDFIQKNDPEALNNNYDDYKVLVWDNQYLLTWE